MSTFTVVKDPFVTILGSIINNSNTCGKILRSTSVTVYFSDNTSTTLSQVTTSFSASTLTISGILNLLQNKTITSITITTSYRYNLGGFCTSSQATGSISNLSISLSSGAYLMKISVKLTPSDATVYL